MYHLKVINLKISRERRQVKERKKTSEKKFAYRFHFNSNKSRELSSGHKRRVEWEPSRKKEKKESE